MGSEEGIPEEVLKELHLGERKSFEKEVKIIFDKKQAMIRFPSVLTTDLDLNEGDRFLLRVDKESEPIKIVCELVRK